MTGTIWMKLAAEIVIAFGILLVAEVLIGTAGLANWVVDLAFWPLDGGQNLTAPETRIMMAIGGGVMIGWGVTLLYVVGPIAAAAPDLARRTIMVAMLCWYVPDSAGSLASGAWVNVIGNTIFLAMFLGPIMWQRRWVKALA